MTQEKQITVQQAAIKTASVSVRSLTINGKQVTLAVFRQLRNEPIVEVETISLLGLPWGTVNYFWGGCVSDVQHLHVVWQKGEELRRACVYSNLPHSVESGLRDDIHEAYVEYLVHLTLEGRLVRDSNSCSAHTFSDRVEGMKLQYDISRDDPLCKATAAPPNSVYRDFYPADDPEEQRKRFELWSVQKDRELREYRAQLEKDLVGLRDMFGIQPEEVDASAALDYLKGTIDTLRDYHTRWSAMYTEMLALDQLFIAV